MTWGGLRVSILRSFWISNDVTVRSALWTSSMLLARWILVLLGSSISRGERLANLSDAPSAPL